MQQQEITLANPYIYQLQQTLQRDQPAAIDWLVLAHHDSQLLSRLDKAFPDSVVAVIALPQSRWQFEEQWIAETVEWALAELRVQGLLLIGHSQSEVDTEPIKLLGGPFRRTDRTDTHASSFSLLDKSRKVQARIEILQQQLTGQLEKLCHLRGVQTRLTHQQLQMHALFYRAESGLFYAYDLEQEKFNPLHQGAVV